MGSKLSEALARKLAQAERKTDPKHLGEPKTRFVVWIDAPIHQYTGNVEVLVFEDYILIHDEWDSNFYRLEWWELMHLADAMPLKLRDELEWERETARREGYEDGQQKHAEELQAEIDRQSKAEDQAGITQIRGRA